MQVFLAREAFFLFLFGVLVVLLGLLNHDYFAITTGTVTKRGAKPCPQHEPDAARRTRYVPLASERVMNCVV